MGEGMLYVAVAAIIILMVGDPSLLDAIIARLSACQ